MEVPASGEPASGDRAAFLTLLERLDRAKAEVGRLMSRTDGDHRAAIVQLRREIAQSLFEVGQAGEALFAQSPELAGFRRRFAQLRSATSIHQAEWPAVKLGERRDEFLASVAPLRAASTEFSRWVRDAVARLG